jgi:hypothetical protein
MMMLLIQPMMMMMMIMMMILLDPKHRATSFEVLKLFAKTWPMEQQKDAQRNTRL